MTFHSISYFRNCASNFVQIHLYDLFSGFLSYQIFVQLSTCSSNFLFNSFVQMSLTSHSVWIFGEAMVMTIQAWSLNVRDFTVPPRERQRQPSLGGLRPLGMAAVAAPSVGTVKSLTFRPHACIVPMPIPADATQRDVLLIRQRICNTPLCAEG